MTDEQEVREAWECVETRWGRVYAGHDTPTFHLKLPVLWHDSLNVIFAKDVESAWHAAAEFTRERKEQIRQVEEEIEYVQGGLDLASGVVGPGLLADSSVARVYKRILAREQAVLADLKRGLK